MKKPFIIILSILAIATICGAVWLKLGNKGKPENPPQNQNNPVQTATSSALSLEKSTWQTYTDEENGYSISYPQGWTRKDILDTSSKKIGISLDSHSNTYNPATGFHFSVTAMSFSDNASALNSLKQLIDDGVKYYFNSNHEYLKSSTWAEFSQMFSNNTVATTLSTSTWYGLPIIRVNGTTGIMMPEMAASQLTKGYPSYYFIKNNRIYTIIGGGLQQWGNLIDNHRTSIPDYALSNYTYLVNLLRANGSTESFDMNSKVDFTKAEDHAFQLIISTFKPIN